MNPISSKDYRKILEKIKMEQPGFYKFLMEDLVGLDKHHYYHAKIYSCFEAGLKSGFLPKQYMSEFEMIKRIRKRFISHEVFGSWVGREDESKEFNLVITDSENFRVKRYWTEEVDGECMEHAQEYISNGGSIIEDEGLLIMKLFGNNDFQSTIKVVVHPEIAYKRCLIGAVFAFSDTTFCGRTSLFLEKVDSVTHACLQ